MAGPALIGAPRVRRSTVALLVALAILIGLWALGAGKELWFDERFVQLVSDRPLGQLFALLRTENNPPLTFLLAHGWQAVFGASEWSLRVLTLLPSLAALVVLESLARRMFGRTAAAMTVVVAAVAGQVVGQAGELRMYPFLMLEVTTALWLAWSFVERPRPRALVWLAVLNLLGLYTHYTYAFFLAWLGPWLLWRARGWRLRVVVSVAAVAAAFLPWYLLSVSAKLSDLSTNVGIERITSLRSDSLLLPLRLIVGPAFLDGSGWQLLRLVAYGIVVAALVAFARRSATRRWPEVAHPTIAIASAILLNVAMLAATGLVLTKHGTTLLPPFLLAVGAGLAALPRLASIRTIAVAALLLIAGTASAIQARHPYVTYRAASRVVAAAESSHDRLLVYPFNDAIVVAPYYRGGLAVRGFFPLKEPRDVVLFDVVRYNFRVTLTEANVDRLSSYVGEARRVWFFYDIPPTPGYWRGDLIRTWFTDHGFTETMYRDMFRNVPPLLVRYDRALN